MGFILGNGFKNNEGGTIWDFDVAPFSGVPQLAFAIEGKAGEEKILIETNEGVKVYSSPIIFGDLRCGTHYDARKEIEGWCEPSYANVFFYVNGYSQRDIYICKGAEKETFAPSFTYHGFRCTFVTGLRNDQVKNDTVKYLECSSDLKERGSFTVIDGEVRLPFASPEAVNN